MILTVEAKVGKSPTVHFSHQPPPDNIEHTLTKDGNAVTKRFKITGDNLTFHRVWNSDGGTYMLCCTSN